MAKGKASLSKIEELHNLIADVFSEAVGEEETVTVIDEEGNITETDEKRYCVSPAMITAAANFVHRQGVTADLKTSEGLTALADKLAKQQKRSRLPSAKVVAIDHQVKEA